VYLLSYALGQSIVLVMAGLGAGWLQKILALRSLGDPLQRLSGWLFLMIGILLVLKGWY
jgi:cytochrome c biogenesis protein CcdA